MYDFHLHFQENVTCVMLLIPCPSVHVCCSTHYRNKKFKIILLEALTVLHIPLHVILDGSLFFLG